MYDRKNIFSPFPFTQALTKKLSYFSHQTEYGKKEKRGEGGGERIGRRRRRRRKKNPGEKWLPKEKLFEKKGFSTT